LQRVHYRGMFVLSNVVIGRNPATPATAVNFFVRRTNFAAVDGTMTTAEFNTSKTFFYS
jgi:hypothetical protein